MRGIFDANALVTVLECSRTSDIARVGLELREESSVHVSIYITWRPSRARYLSSALLVVLEVLPESYLNLAQIGLDMFWGL